MAAKGQTERVVAEMMKNSGVNEQLKKDDPMRWVQAMNTLKEQTEEAVIQKRVFGRYSDMNERSDRDALRSNN